MRALLLAALLAGCSSDDAPSEGDGEAGRCADYDAAGNAYFGDLHVHTGYSFDAKAYGNDLTPADAYAFAAGGEVALAGGRTARLERALDFAAVTDHGEFLGEIEACTTPGAPGYDSGTCRDYRDPEQNGAFNLGVQLSFGNPTRLDDVCGDDGQVCLDGAARRWKRMREDAGAAYARCELTTFPAYEYTNTLGVSNLHRNVVFAGDSVPERPVSYFEAPTPPDLWRELDAQCTGECDVVVIPHNSNLSNGQLFHLAGTDAQTAALRARMEPLVEVFQHKGDSECRASLPGSLGEGDPRCDFEKQRPADAEVCPEDEPGSGGMRLSGCVHRLDFVRDALGEGLRAEAGLGAGAALGLNPYRLGIIGSTDTHNGTPGHVDSEGFPGHIGHADAEAADRLGSGNVTHDGIINNPGGLAAVWAPQNTRADIFAAFRRRETFATSGPRIRLRLLVARGDAPDASAGCEQLMAHPGAVPMGGVVPAGDGPLHAIAVAYKDELALDAVQLISISKDGGAAEVVPIAQGPADELCVTSPVPEAAGLVYLRAYEVESDRWSVAQCAALAPDKRPAECDAGLVADRVRQRAWSSPVWLP